MPDGIHTVDSLKLLKSSALSYEWSTNNWKTARTTDTAVQKQSLKKAEAKDMEDSGNTVLPTNRFPPRDSLCRGR